MYPRWQCSLRATWRPSKPDPLFASYQCDASFAPDFGASPHTWTATAVPASAATSSSGCANTPPRFSLMQARLPNRDCRGGAIAVWPLGGARRSEWDLGTAGSSIAFGRSAIVRPGRRRTSRWRSCRGLPFQTRGCGSPVGDPFVAIRISAQEATAGMSTCADKSPCRLRNSVPRIPALHGPLTPCRRPQVPRSSQYSAEPVRLAIPDRYETQHNRPISSVWAPESRLGNSGLSANDYRPAARSSFELFRESLDAGHLYGCWPFVAQTRSR